MTPRDARSDSGETLVEVLVAVVILGLAVVSILGGFGTALRVGVLHRDTAKEDSILRSYGEDIVNAGYQQCTPAGTGSAPTYSSQTIDGYVASVTNVAYWTSGSNPATFGGCANDSSGAEKVTIQVVAPAVNGVTHTQLTESLDIFVRQSP
jgi:Tfp pilus assembly protein PilV